MPTPTFAALFVRCPEPGCTLTPKDTHDHRRRYLYFLVLVTDNPHVPVGDALVSVTLREGEDFLDDLYAEFGDLYVLATEEGWE